MSGTPDREDDQQKEKRGGEERQLHVAQQRPAGGAVQPAASVISPGIAASPASSTTTANPRLCQIETHDHTASARLGPAAQAGSVAPAVRAATAKTPSGSSSHRCGGR